MARDSDRKPASTGPEQLIHGLFHEAATITPNQPKEPSRCPRRVRRVDEILRAHGCPLTRTVGGHRQSVHLDNPNVVTVPSHAGRRIAAGALASIRRASGSTTYDDRASRDLRAQHGAAGGRTFPTSRAAAVAAHVELLRLTGRPVPEPITHEVARIVPLQPPRQEALDRRVGRVGRSEPPIDLCLQHRLPWTFRMKPTGEQQQCDAVRPIGLPEPRKRRPSIARALRR